MQVQAAFRALVLAALVVLVTCGHGRDQMILAAAVPPNNDARRPARPPKQRVTNQSALPEGVWPFASLVLGRPTDHGITVSVMPTEDITAYIEFWSDGPATQHGRSALQTMAARTSIQVRLDNLTANARYNYRLCYRLGTDGQELFGPTFSFYTQRAPSSTYVFEIQGDSHPERPQQHDPRLYAQTLRAAAADHPDFYICMGDDFSVDTLPRITNDAVDAIYRHQRSYLALVAQSSPLFLVNGNHEQAAACNLTGTADNVAVWAQNARNAFFPQPVPDGFYTGDQQRVPFIGQLADYYAWTWGDALFVVIDPYWHSPVPVDNVLGGDPKTRELWDVTLGDAQYQWLKQTLEQSKSKYKFVFAHHVNGTGRGGIEQAPFFEWGGRGRRGDWEFNARRPNWELPIHQLMVKYGVTIFFQGHDHVFAHQQLDGVTYQTLPDPANPHYALNNAQAYRSGDVLPGSGRLRVTVTAQQVKVEYVRSYLPQDQTPARPDGEIAYHYTVSASSTLTHGVTRDRR